MKGEGRRVSIYILDCCHYGGVRCPLLPHGRYYKERFGNGVGSAYVCLYRQISSVPCFAVLLFCGFVCAGIFQLDIIRSAWKKNIAKRNFNCLLLFQYVDFHRVSL